MNSEFEPLLLSGCSGSIQNSRPGFGRWERAYLTAGRSQRVTASC